MSESTSELIISENKTPETLDIDGSGEHCDVASNKRTDSEESSASTPAKKARKKPVPQFIENMKEYFDNNILEQLTTATLRHWLKERSVHCTTREKKESLIEKVKKQFLKETE